MDKAKLFPALEKLKKAELLDLVKSTYEHLSVELRGSVFIKYMPTEYPGNLDSKEVINDIVNFQELSLASHYYAPFYIDSKNYMDVPEETDEWFEKMETYFERCCQLYKQGDGSNAIIGFQILYSLLDKLGDDEIVFADELGTWMMGGDTKKYSLHYIQAASETCDDETFAKHMLPVLREDSYSSFCDKVFHNIKSHSSKSQIDCVKKLAKKEGVRLTSK